MLKLNDKEIKTRLGLTKGIKKIECNRNYGGNLNILYEWYGVSTELDINELIFLIEEYIFKKYNPNFFKLINDVVENECYDYNRILKYFKYMKTNPSDSSSDKFYKLKYGNKWEDRKSYFKNKKVNIYDPKYISKRDNISLDEAVVFIKKYKTDKVTSLDGFIKRHGEEKGMIMFSKFQKTSSINLDKYVKEHGEEKGMIIWDEYKSGRKENSPWCVEYWTKRGYNEEESINEVKHYQKYNSGVSYDAILLSCDNDIEFADYIYSLINKKKDGSSFKHCLKECNDNHLAANLLYLDKCSKKDNISIKYLRSIGFDLEDSLKYKSKIKYKEYTTKVERGCVTPREFLSEFKSYCRLVDFYTNKNLSVSGEIKFGHDYKEKRGLKTNHIDHIFSKFEGFKYEIPEYIIGSIENLDLIPYLENLRKHIKSNITIKKLLSNYNNSFYEKIK